MKLTGKYILRASIGGKMILQETSTGPAVFASFDNSEASQAAIAAIVTGAAKDGGSVYDADAKQYIAGSLDQLVAEPA